MSRGAYHMNKIQSKKRQTNIFQCLMLIIAACMIHGVMQGVHDNYGIMMNGLVRTTGISYSYISFCIGTGAADGFGSFRHTDRDECDGVAVSSDDPHCYLDWGGKQKE